MGNTSNRLMLTLAGIGALLFAPWVLGLSLYIVGLGMWWAVPVVINGIMLTYFLFVLGQAFMDQAREEGGQNDR